MPIYEYTCTDCGQTNEVLMSRGDKPPPCPDCGSGEVTKEFSVFAMSSPTCPSERKCENSDGPMPSCPNAGKCRITA